MKWKRKDGCAMLIILEGIALCFVLLFVCSVGIANGPVNMVFFYEKNVQRRVVELGLITEKKIRRNSLIASAALFIPVLLFPPAAVYGLNGARAFGDLFLQMSGVLLIAGLFDRIFIDWYWVGRTKAWIIPGTEDLKPYIPGKTLLMKWTGTVIGFPLIAAVVSAVLVRI